MTVLEPANAVLAALQILSGRSPRVYAKIRGEIEPNGQHHSDLIRRARSRARSRSTSPPAGQAQ
jgi:hypothetical protein